MNIDAFARFLVERRAFALAHTCERCAWHDRDRNACAHRYPDGRHRERAFDERAPHGTFCKEFELE